MSYCQLSDVSSLIARFGVNVSSTPTSTQAQAINNDVGYELDVAIEGAGFLTPITDVKFGWYLLALNAYGSAAAILKSMFPDAKGPGETPAYAFWEARYQLGLKGVKDGTLIPPGLPRNARFVAPVTYLTLNPDQDSSLGANADPTFTVSKVF